MSEYAIDEVPDSYPVGIIPRRNPLAQAILADCPGASLVFGDTSGKYGPDTDMTLLYTLDGAGCGFTSFSQEAKDQAVGSWQRDVFHNFWVKVPGTTDHWAARIEREENR